jgi:hypothetical protein
VIRFLSAGFWCVVIPASQRHKLLREIEIKHRRKWLSISSERFMDFQIKTFLALERGNHVIAIIGGAVPVRGLDHIFNKVIDETRRLLDCKILIDFQDSILKILPSDILEFVEGIEPETWPHHNKVALVSAPEIEQYQQLAMLGEGLIKQSLNVGVFYDMKEAISWLSDIR